MSGNDVAVLGVIILIVSIIVFIIAQSSVEYYESPSGRAERMFDSSAEGEYAGAVMVRGLAVIGGIVGGVLLFVGFISDSPKKQTEYPYPPQQHIDPTTTAVYICNYCRNNLRYLPQYRRWYCDTCQRYI
jgi:hypothetical protein